MDGSPSSIVMFGLGNGTFNGSPSLMVTRGLGIGEAASVSATSGWAYTAFAGNKGHVAFEGNKGHVAMDSQG